MVKTNAYAVAHRRVCKERGKARDHVCSHCKIMQARHWAFDHTVSNPPRDATGSPYSMDPNRYVALCAGCHTNLDRAALEAVREYA